MKSLNPGIVSLNSISIRFFFFFTIKNFIISFKMNYNKYFCSNLRDFVLITVHRILYIVVNVSNIHSKRVDSYFFFFFSSIAIRSNRYIDISWLVFRHLAFLYLLDIVGVGYIRYYYCYRYYYYYFIKLWKDWISYTVK